MIRGDGGGGARNLESNMHERSSRRYGTQERRESSPDERQALRRLERESFILLQHAYTLAQGDSPCGVNPHRLSCDLCFDDVETERLVRYLSWLGYLRESPTGPHLVLSPLGIEYLEHACGRRRSVRAGSREVPPLLFLGSQA